MENGDNYTNREPEQGMYPKEDFEEERSSEISRELLQKLGKISLEARDAVFQETEEAVKQKVEEEGDVAGAYDLVEDVREGVTAEQKTENQIAEDWADDNWADETRGVEG